MAKLQNKLCICLCFVVATTVAAADIKIINNEASSDSKEDVKIFYNINSIIDDNIYHVQRILKSFEPMELEDLSVMGLLKLKNGSILKLSSVSRSDNCIADYESQQLCGDYNFGWTDLTFSFNYSYKIFAEMTGKLDGTFDSASVKLNLCGDLKTLAIRLNELKFTKLGKINFEITGPGASYINKIGNVVANACKGLVKKIVEKKATEVVRQKIEQINEFIKEHVPLPEDSDALRAIMLQRYLFDNVVNQVIE